MEKSKKSFNPRLDMYGGLSRNRQSDLSLEPFRWTNPSRLWTFESRPIIFQLEAAYSQMINIQKSPYGSRRVRKSETRIILVSESMVAGCMIEISSWSWIPPGSIPPAAKISMLHSSREYALDRWALQALGNSPIICRIRAYSIKGVASLRFG
jgi:hypothetical protein